ncbi:hypothetical protein [Rhizobium leguminosarum]|uniref:Uncharacterized protein n=1 Tax=Rhizobium leguminosarum TaxID=384 RepID=A0A1B1CES2_RHILE|nr:hypothetical protein [Rhizobium leguminosarum]ANP88258.1 hypothetical protein BA011_22650 [Rhizobium leguminosarum]
MISLDLYHNEKARFDRAFFILQPSFRGRIVVGKDIADEVERAADQDARRLPFSKLISARSTLLQLLMTTVN